MNTVSYSVSLAKELESVRQNEIERLRKIIATGKYEVKNNLLAKALMPCDSPPHSRANPHH